LSQQTGAARFLGCPLRARDSFFSAGYCDKNVF
jgi:hypothetical protein